MFQLYFTIFLSVSLFCCFIVILARSAHSGFIDTHAAIYCILSLSDLFLLVKIIVNRGERL